MNPSVPTNARLNSVRGCQRQRIKKRGPKTPPLQQRFRSEGILQTQLSTISTINIGITRANEGDLTISAQCLGDRSADTCLTRRNSVGFATVRRYEADTTLDILGSSTNGAFISQMSVCRRISVVRTSPTRVRLYIDIRTCEGSRRGSDSSSCGESCDSSFEHLINTFQLLAEWLPADEQRLDQSRLQRSTVTCDSCNIYLCYYFPSNPGGSLPRYGLRSK